MIHREGAKNAKTVRFFYLCFNWTIDENEFPKVARTAFKVLSSFEEADREDKDYWLSRIPKERLQYIELLRRINHGHAATARLQRVLEIAERIRDSLHFQMR